MRGSDIVDLFAEVLPRWVVRVVLLGVLAGVALFGYTGLIDWYIADMASGLTELWIPIFEDMLADIAPTPTA